MLEFLKVKKVGLVLLALIMITSLFAVSAMAEEHEDQQPAIFYQNLDDNSLQVWIMDGNETLDIVDLDDAVDEGFEVKGVTDVDAEGQYLIYLYNRDAGEVKVWVMEAFVKVDEFAITNPSPDRETIDPVWDMMAVEDLTLNDEADIIWQKDDGELAVWLMQDYEADETGRILNFDGTPYVKEAWRIGAICDLMGDDEVEVIWHAVSGEFEDELAYWKLDLDDPEEFAAFESGRLINRPPDDYTMKADWRLSDSVDLFKDGPDELLFQGRVELAFEEEQAFWRMDGRYRDASGRLDEIGKEWYLVGASMITVEDPFPALEGLRDNTTLTLDTIEDNVVEATIEYPVEISDMLAGYMVDALITADDDFAKGTKIEIEYNDNLVGEAELDADTGEVYFSELIEDADPDAPVRTSILEHEDREDVWKLTITSPVAVDTTVYVSSVVSNDDFATEFEIASDDAALDFPGDEDLALEVLIKDTEMSATFDGDKIIVTVDYPKVICAVLADYMVDATIEVVAGYDDFPAGTEIAITYNGDPVGDLVELDDAKDSVYLSELILEADPEAPVRTPITAHAGRTGEDADVWEFTITPTDDVRSKLDLASVVSDDDFASELEIADASVEYKFFAEPLRLALKDLREGTDLELNFDETDKVTATTTYPKQDDISYFGELDDFMVDVWIEAEEALAKGTIIEFNGFEIQLEEEMDKAYLSELILEADPDATVRPKVKVLFGQQDVHQDIWEFTISTPVEIDENKLTAKVQVAEAFDNNTIVTIAEDETILNIDGDIDALVDETSLSVYVEENQIKVEVAYGGIADTLKYYDADALIERDYGDRFVAGTEIQIFYNGNEVGVAELTEQTEEIYLSELIAKADPDAPVRTPITAHEGTDEWVLVVSPPGEGRFLAGGTIKSQVSDDDFATAETLDTDTFELDFKYPYDTDNPVYLYDEDGFLEGTYNTIQGAIDEASDDYTLMVYPDEYDENVAINKDGLTLKSVEKHEAVIEGLVTIGDANNFTIEDFKVVNEDERAVYISEDDVANILLKNLDIEVTNANAITNKFPGGIEIEIRDSVISASGNNNHIIYINGGFSSVGELNRPSDVTLIGNQFRGVDLAGGVGVGIEIDNAVVEDNHFDVETDHAAFEIWTAGQGDTTFNIDDDNTFDVTGDGEEILIDTVAYDAGDLPIDQDKHFD